MKMEHFLGTGGNDINLFLILMIYTSTMEGRRLKKSIISSLFFDDNLKWIRNYICMGFNLNYLS